MKMSPVVHFEMPTKDRKRVADFYSKAFGWNMQLLGPEMGDYVLATTTPVDSKTQRPTEPGAINGGFFEYQDNDLNRAPHLVVGVEDLDESMKAVTAFGGQIVGEKMDIPGVGVYVSIKDTEGNLVGMLQPANR